MKGVAPFAIAGAATSFSAMPAAAMAAVLTKSRRSFFWSVMTVLRVPILLLLPFRRAAARPETFRSPTKPPTCAAPASA